MVKKSIKKVVEEPIKEIEEVFKEEPKKKRVMTSEQLEHLARIRKIAAAKKTEIKERDTKVRNLEKEELELKAKKYDNIQEQKQKLSEKPKEIKKKVKDVVKDVVSDEDNDYSSEDEVVQKKQSHQNKPKKISDIDDMNVHHLAFQASQHQLLEKVMSNRILNNLSNYKNIVGMKYY